MNRQAWRDFFITLFFLGAAFVIALLSSVAAEQGYGRLGAIAAAVSLLLALGGALYIIPRLARNVRLEFLRFAIRTSVTLEGLLFIIFLFVIGFAAWNTANNLLYLVLSAMLAFLIAANLIARVSLADMSVQLRFPDHVFAGEAASITVTLTNHKRLMPSYSLVIEALSEDANDAATQRRGDTAAEKNGTETTVNLSKSQRGAKNGAVTASPRIGVPASQSASGLGKLAYFVLAPARSSVRQRIEHTFKRRGRYPITGFRLATKFPAGFFKKWRRIDARGEIVVYPKPQPLDDFYHALPMLAGQVQSHARGSGDDLYSIRRYHPSDQLRNIDWKATAKSMTMMVREHTREDERRLTIVFDTFAHHLAAQSAQAEQSADHHDAKAAQEFQEKFERAIEMAASLANHFILERSDVELVTTNEKLNVKSGSGYEHLYKILRSLAMIQPTAQPADDEQAMEKRRRWWGFIKRTRDSVEQQHPEDTNVTVPTRRNGGIAWRLIDELPVLGDERRFKVLITSAAKGTIPAHVWRSAHVVFMDDL
ncbi:MAG TPA: DUF58 domain-containing protein [Blastocatellia bacterium]|nr:DUF58 domain-containing protein [Blastocatellia bacterium]